MWLWGLIFLFLAIGFGAALLYLVSKLKKLNFITVISGKIRCSVTIVSLLIIVLAVLLFSFIMGFLNCIIVMLHMLIGLVIADLICLIVRKNEKKALISGTVLILVALYLIAGAINCFHVDETDYTLKTSKDIGSLRVVQFADSHLGTTFDGEGLLEYVDEINELNPDVVLITGDFVDDNTTREEMISGCESLSHLETTYGVYFCFGNHDKGYSDPALRGFTGDDLIAELTDNGVTVLQDEAVLIDDRFYIVGRQDYSEADRGVERASAEGIISELDTSKYIILMNHQPNDYDAESQTGADLVLSGHTHGGQLFPVNDFGVWIGVNDATYGHININGTDFIVTSGISDWELIFKTGCKSEFNVIDING